MKKLRIALPILLAVVLLAGSAAPVFAGPPPFAGRRPAKTIVDVASTDPQFSILVTALTETGLASVLDGRGQFTVFAPTNAAFEAAAADLGLTLGELVDLLLANPDYLTDVLLYHVVRGRRNSRAVLGSRRIRTLQGGVLYQSGGVLTDQVGRQVAIVATNIRASNGLIHVIDNVVLPYLP